LKAWVLIREAPFYRRQSFVSGLKACGFDVLLREPDRGRPEDVLVLWSRYGSNHEIATRFEAAGGTVLICENGYLNADGSSPKFAVHPNGPKPTDHYAIGLGFHNDSTRIVAGGPERWAALGVPLKPWRTDGEHVLICPNRPFGVPGRMMPQNWPQACAARLRTQTKREVRIRAHPGNSAPMRALSEDLRDCWAVVVWSSSCAVHALQQGYPTFIEAPYQILKGAGATGSVDEPVMPERLPHFERMAHAQWQVQEIASGEPFARLLSTTREGALARGT
jgi:hypothetical protein